MTRTPLAIIALLCAATAPATAHATLRATQSDSATYQTGVDQAGTERYLELLDDVGASAQRVSLRWGQIAAGCGVADTDERRDPDLDCYDWSAPDRVIDDSRAQFVTVREVPCWLHRDCRIDAAGHAYVGATDTERDEFTDELAAFLEAATQRYGDRARNWSIWNEPNGRDFWSETVSGGGQPPAEVRACHFVDTYTRVVEALRDTPGGDELRFGFGPLGPSSSRQPLRFLEAAAACEGDAGDLVLEQRHVDALALHSYPGSVDGDPYDSCPSWQGSGVLDRRSTSLQCIDEVRARLDERDDELLSAFAAAPLWVLETGYEDVSDDPELGIDPLTQARYYALALERLSEAGASVVSWYPAVDGGTVEDWQSGLAKANAYTHRPLALAFEAPLAVRPLKGGSWRAWTSRDLGDDVEILRGRDCDHESTAPAAERYDLEPLQAATADAGVVAEFDDAAAGDCLLLRIDGELQPSIVVALQAGGDPAALEPVLVTARVIDDPSRDPRGDVLVERSGDQPGNPTVAAIVRTLLFGANEPIRYDPTLAST